MRISDYPIEVYRDFEKAVDGDFRYFEKLMKDGYMEWAAFSNGILGDDKAVMWLLQNGFPEFGVLANGMNDEPAAMSWLRHHPSPLLYNFCQATKQDNKAKEYLKAQNQLPLLILAEVIRKAMLRRIKRETFWYKINW